MNQTQNYNDIDENSRVGLSKSERSLIAAVLVIIAALLTMDIFTDSREGINWGHLSTEISVVLVSAFGFFILVRDFFYKSRKLTLSENEVIRLKEESLRWKEESKKHVEGLSQAIDSQLERWELSISEKEVALLLLKGLSLKEIATIRETSEKTARAHSVAIYHKSALSGRSELAAYFLEDLLLPKNKS